MAEEKKKGPAKDSAKKPEPKQEDVKKKAKAVLAELIKLTKTGKLPQELYDLIVDYAGKKQESEEKALKDLKSMAENFVRSHKQTSNPDQKEVERIISAFKKRRDTHGLFSKSWANYMNDPLCIWMFDYQKVWADYSTGKI